MPEHAMVIDAHQHVFWHGRDDTGLIADMDQHGIDLAWLLTWEISPEEDQAAYHRMLNPLALKPDGTHAGITLADLVRAQRRYPNRFILGYCPHPANQDAPGLFEAAHRMYGVRVCGEWKFRMLIDDPRSLELFRTAGRLGCPVVLHLDVPYLVSAGDGRGMTYQPIWFGGTVDNLERAILACPQTTFIGHAPGFWRHLSGDADASPDVYPTGPITPGGRVLQLLERFPTLYADLSAESALRALQRDVSFTRRFIARFADRLLFARDFYGDDLHRFLQSLDLPATQRDLLYSENTVRLLGR